ncbi:MAG: ComF family protein [Proteobacteria bacterium]|nr:ComF family protein [Pseudomonadota bacterium]
MDSLLPPQCLGCSALVEESGTLCSVCWGEITFLGPPQCHVCGLPFEYDLGEGALCGACVRRAPVYRRARAALAYDPASRGLVIAFKHADRTYAAPAFAGWMARAGAALLGNADIIAPVPLHRLRLLSRRYNQAALLGHGLSRASGVAIVPDLLVRKKHTRSQGRLSRAQRALNVQGAFAVKAGRKGCLAGRRVLLIDDVLTTGVTAAACAKVLKRAGAAAVDVLTLARVVRPMV